jgi:hypothetical protein
MKKMFLPGIMAVCLVYLSSANQAMAQEDESTLVHITVKEDGRVTTDTTYELKEGQEPDMVKKMLQDMVGEDDMIMKKEVIIIKKGDDDCNVQSMDMGINLDSIEKAHVGGKVMVFKDENGNITVKELGEDQDHEIMIIESDEDGKKVNIKKMKTEDGKMTIISEDEQVEWSDEEGENVEVHVIKKGDKDVKVVKKVTVEIEDEAEEGVEKEVEVEVKTEKKKKELKEK